MAPGEAFTIPRRLVAACRHEPERRAWLARLPAVVAELRDAWSLTLDRPFDADEGSIAWVAPARRADGSAAVLKLAVPHMEGRDEIAGLRAWNGDGVVRVLQARDDLGAMLLERCVPGTSLRALPWDEQDAVVAGLLRRLWRVPPEPGRFRPLAFMTSAWGRASLRQGPGTDPALHAEALRCFAELPASADRRVLLATDLHAGNVLRAEREPWLVIDPKPFVGDPAYDATQHLLNGLPRLLADPRGTVGRFADLLQVDAGRVRRWLFARLALGGLGDRPAATEELARKLGP